MVQVRPDFFESRGERRELVYFVAEDEETGAVIGTVTGVDHIRAFDDPQKGSSLWCLAVNPQTGHAAVGDALTRWRPAHFIARGAACMALPVLHDPEGPLPTSTKPAFTPPPPLPL